VYINQHKTQNSCGSSFDLILSNFNSILIQIFSLMTRCPRNVSLKPNESLIKVNSKKSLFIETGTFCVLKES
jgi:hypothetical protein